MIGSVGKPFAAGGGLHVMHGNLGRGVSKISAVAEQHQVVTAPAVVFDDQDDVVAAFKRGELEKDCIVVLRFQGPKANGMPELHKLTPPLGVLQDKGFKVALITDGRMSGASGKVPSAIHMCPECMDGGPLAKVRDGDIIVLNTQTGEVNVQIDASRIRRPVFRPKTAPKAIISAWAGKFSALSAPTLPRLKPALAICFTINGSAITAKGIITIIKIGNSEMSVTIKEIMTTSPVIPVMVINHLEQAVPLARSAGRRRLESTGNHATNAGGAGSDPPHQG